MTSNNSDKTVFISYRRSVSAYIARAVFMDLRQNGYDAFMDVESIDSGEFDRIILGQIAARVHFVVILTPSAVERCAEPGDWLRREIEEAMGRLRNRYLKQPVFGEIIPVSAVVEAAVQQKMTENSKQPTPTEQQLSAEQSYMSAEQKWLVKDYLGVIADCDAAIEINPKYADAYSRRGGAKFHLGDKAGAISDVDRAIQFNPRDVRAYFNRAVMRQSNKDLPGAIADYSEVIRLNAQDASTYKNRGIARAEIHDVAGAIADYQMYLDLGGGQNNGDQIVVENAIRDLKRKLR